MNKIYFDLDGVMANFDKAVVLHTGLHYWDRTESNIWDWLNDVPKLYFNLEVLAGSLDMFNRVVEARGLTDVEVLTSLPRSIGETRTADKDKREWVKQFMHPTVTVNTVVGGRNKVNFLQDNPGALLIDDWHLNIDKWIASGGVGILHVDPASTIEKLRVLGIL